MRACIYARYSSENQRESSIEDQVRSCKLRIESEGWSLTTTYSDYALSGATHLRPGYQQLLADARAGAFDVLLAEALDRLSRDQEHVAGFFKQLSFCGVKIVTLAEGEISELHVGLKGTMNALFLKDLAQKTRRGLEGRVRQGRSGGGLCYGYDVVREIDGRGEPVHGGRTINEAEAAIVRRIFKDYGNGRSPRAIAKALNAEQVAGPHGRSWGASTIHGNWRRGTGILNNELYLGKLVWNRQRYIKDPGTGKRLARPNPKAAWIVQPVPELRIIDDDTWSAVKRRQGAHRDGVERTESGYRLNATHRRRFLFSGLLRCAVCGGTYTIIGHDRYGCANRRNRGTCDNGHVIGRHELENRVLAGLKNKLLAPELVREFIAEFHAELNRRGRDAELAYEVARRERSDIERKIKAMVDAIENGVFTASTRDRLLELERRKAELDGLKPPAPVARFHPNVAEIYRQKVAHLWAALNDPALREEAAEVLRGLIEEIRLAPVGDGGLQIELFGELAAIMAVGESAKTNRAADVTARFSLVAGTRNQLSRTVMRA
jgi:site-specific DNA recombinase